MPFSEKFLDSQKKYYGIIEDYFGDYFSKNPNGNALKEENINSYFSNKEERLYNLYQQLDNLWHQYSECISEEIKSYPGLKTSFYIRAYLPENMSEYIRRNCIFSDHISFHDPLIEMSKNTKSRMAFYSALINSQKILSIKKEFFREKDLLFSFIPPPKQAGCKDFFQKKSFERLSQLSGESISSTIDIANILLDEKRGKLFIKSLNSSENTDAGDLAIVVGERDYASEILIPKFESVAAGTLNEAKKIEDIISGLYGIMYHSLSSSIELNSHPIFDKYFFYDEFLNLTKYCKNPNPQDQIVANALSIEKDFSWLGNLEANDLFRIRSHEDFLDLRDTLNINLNKLRTLDISDEKQQFEIVKNNLYSELSKQSRKISKQKREITNRYDLKVKKYASCLLVGTLAVHVWDIEKIIQTCGIKLIPEVYTDLREIPETFKKLNNFENNPISILLMAKEH